MLIFFFIFLLNVTNGDFQQDNTEITSLNIKSYISNRFARTNVIIKMKNTSKVKQEVRFSEAIPKTALITDFTIKINGQNYKGLIKENVKGNEIFEHVSFVIFFTFLDLN